MKYKPEKLSLTEKLQTKLRQKLESEQIDNATINRVIDSGYIYWDSFHPIYGKSMDWVVQDTFYGNKEHFGYINKDIFIEYIKSGKQSVISKIPEFYVSSLGEIEEILSKDPHKQFYEGGRLTFRGQPEDYFTNRPIPNPILKYKNGDERLILPGMWRGQELLNPTERVSEREASIFGTMLCDELIYHGIDDWQNLLRRKFHQYGLTSLSDLEDIDDEECQLLYERWHSHKVIAPHAGDFLLLEQHYGMSTWLLDLTFDVRTALFFATHDFVKLDNGKATFKPLASKRKQRVLYAFVFHWPPVKKTSDLITTNLTFHHLPPLRPLRQQCAVRNFDEYRINEAVTDLHAIIYLNDDFKIDGLPGYEFLFPKPENDLFYGELLKLKYRHPKYFAEIVDYEY